MAKKSSVRKALAFVCKMLGHRWKSRGLNENLLVWECPMCKQRRTQYIPKGQFTIEN